MSSPTQRGSRLAERFVTVRTIPPTTQSPGRLGTVIGAANGAPRLRAPSAGAVWTVGGTIVTEGVASTTNGRGGRITSGSLAPHYAAGFLNARSPSKDELQHGDRLAVAMDISRDARMLQYGGSRRTSSSEPCVKRTVWRNNAWERECARISSKPSNLNNRRMPLIPFRVLDAPALRDDFYCSLLAYSHTINGLAVGLGPHVYIWSERRTNQSTQLPASLSTPFAAHVTSLSFSSKEGGNGILAVGRADGRITLWSPLDRDPRITTEHTTPISYVCFRPNIVRRQSVREPAATVSTEELLVGDDHGNVTLYSIEWPDQVQRDLFDWHGSMTKLAHIRSHDQQICGIAWSAAGEYFATGANDNRLSLFDRRRFFQSPPRRTATTTVTPLSSLSSTRGPRSPRRPPLAPTDQITPALKLHTFTLNAAVKAIAFAPWQPSLLAAGGGSNDRCIHFFHARSGATLATIDCHAQVTSLVWSARRKEVAATFGFAQPEHAYRVAVFAWPSCRRILAIPWWNEERALYAIPYPGGPTEAGVEGKRGGVGRRGRGRGEKKGMGRGGMAGAGKRTREEGCLVIAASDASIKFHEVWSDERSGGGGGTASMGGGDGGGGGGGGGVFGGSQILEDVCSAELERAVAIR